MVQINETFSRNFQEMAVAGEVSLGMYLSVEIVLDFLVWLSFIGSPLLR